MKKISILGSTGSIGTSALDIIRMYPDRFRPVVLAGARNTDLLVSQINEFSPDIAVVYGSEEAYDIRKRLPADSRTEILYGPEGYEAAAAYPSTDLVLLAIVGAAGLRPALSAINAGKNIALANKETLVMAGELVMKLAGLKGVNIFPVDSEHSAVFQSMSGQRREDLTRIILTASGGPFRTLPDTAFSEIKPSDALKHPNWNMGSKITIDSATLMNKGLEVIEACRLFDLAPEKVEVVVHPQSIIHSMAVYRDGSVISQMGMPDMKAAIAYSFSYPERLDIGMSAPDFPSIGAITFEKPDMKRFPCLALAYEALAAGGTMPAVLNAANEIAVSFFLDGRMGFTDIPRIVEKTMSLHDSVKTPELDDIFCSDSWARRIAAEQLKD
jgi:1-deoxy-D-xylulose-5-phosphate reductoisomerase